MRIASWLMIGAGVFAGAAFAACGTDEGSVFVTPGPEASTQTDAGPGLDDDAEFFNGPYTDFPAGAIVDEGAPANAEQLFRDAATAGGGGPCLVEPQIGTMYPKNWLRPRFRWVKAADNQNLFEIRIHVQNQTQDLIVYTADDRYTMPKAMWDGLRSHSAGVPMTITVRAGTLQSGAVSNVVTGSSGDLSIAPVEAPGTIVYWTGAVRTDAGIQYKPALKGFHVGDETVQDVLKPSQIGTVGGEDTKCLGCHTSTPDGLFTALSARAVATGDGNTRIALRSVDGNGTAAPISPSALSLLARTEQEFPTFSRAHYTTTERIALSMLKVGDGFQIVWTNLDATSDAMGVGWDVVKRNGDPNYAALASPSHDGKNIVYVSTPEKNTAGTIVTAGALYTVPWGGGTATEVAGANDPNRKQFYPSFSPDDKFIIYDRSDKGTKSYGDRNDEIYVVPSAGGTATRLSANDPPACWPSKSPGIGNSWPKWSPGVRSFGGKDYYFVVFSSSRSFLKPLPELPSRLYITPIVVEGTNVTSYPAIYLWNQPEMEDNHSPAWDEFKLGPPR